MILRKCSSLFFCFFRRWEHLELTDDCAAENGNESTDSDWYTSDTDEDDNVWSAAATGTPRLGGYLPCHRYQCLVYSACHFAASSPTGPPALADVTSFESPICDRDKWSFLSQFTYVALSEFVILGLDVLLCKWEGVGRGDGPAFTRSLTKVQRLPFRYANLELGRGLPTGTLIKYVVKKDDETLVAMG